MRTHQGCGLQGVHGGPRGRDAAQRAGHNRLADAPGTGGGLTPQPGSSHTAQLSDHARACQTCGALICRGLPTKAMECDGAARNIKRLRRGLGE